MADNAYNSLKSVVENFTKESKNALQILQGLNQVSLSGGDEVTFTITDSDGDETSLSLPSFAHIQNEIERLDENVKGLSGVSDGDTMIRMSDGTYRQVHLSELENRPDGINVLESPSQFKRKSNWFFENFVSPYLYVEFDISGQVDVGTRRARVKRYILNLDNDDKLNKFNDDWNDESGIDYVTFLEDLRENRITHYIDEDVVDLPLNRLALKGKFSVESVREEDMIRNIGGVSKEVLTRIFTLDSMSYVDNTDPENPIGRTISSGDFLILNDGNNDTKFKVIYADTAQKEVALQRTEGYGALTPGSDRLKMYSELSGDKRIEVGIGHDEHQVVFIKPINEKHNVEADEYSPGVGFYSNNLQINLPDEMGGRMALQEFYRKYVIDFGAHIFNMARERIPPAIYAEDPDAPVLAGDNFEVKQINTHITESEESSRLEELYGERVDLDAEIDSINNNINRIRNKINSGQLDGKELSDQESRLEREIERKDRTTKLLRGTITEMINISSSNPNLVMNPKYRVRGFWDIPRPKESDRTAPQEVVQFIVQYRYIRKDGNASNPDLIEYTDANGVKRSGVFSNWVEYRTDSRRREYDEDLRRFVWAEDGTENAEIPNVNQLDIPISYGEAVEIRIKSVSEAGYPTSPATSDWSESTIIPFPDNLIDRNEQMQDILQSALRDESRIEFQEELDSRGLGDHLDKQFYENDNFYAHTSKDVAYSDGNGEVSNLQETIAALTKRINDLESQLFAERSTIDLDDD